MKVNKLNRGVCECCFQRASRPRVLRAELVFEGNEACEMSHDEMYLEANYDVRRMIVGRTAPRAQAPGSLVLGHTERCCCCCGSSCQLFNLINVFAFAQLFMPN